MFLSMNWISDFVDFTGLDKLKLINQFSLSTAEVENDIFFKGSDISGIVVAEITHGLLAQGIADGVGKVPGLLFKGQMRASRFSFKIQSLMNI